MLIIGAGNLGKHLLDQLLNEGYSEKIIFFDENLTNDFLVYNKFIVINNTVLLEDYFKQNSPDFITAIGHPRIRKKVTDKILRYGGKLSTVISKYTHISSFSRIGPGAIIQPGCCISHNTIIGMQCVIHANSLIGHDVSIGDYFSCGSNVNILSPAQIGNSCIMGANSLFMPGNKIGNNVIVGAAQVVDKTYGDNDSVVAI